MLSFFCNSFARIIFILTLFLFLTGYGVAATHTVTSTGDAGTGSLREIIAGATSGDTINFALTPPAVIDLFTSLLIKKSLTITGPGATSLTVRMIGADSVFRIKQPAGGDIHVTISGMTVTGGDAAIGGGIYLVDGNLRLEDCRVTGNIAGAGGGVYVMAGSLTAVDTEISGNTVAATGGGISAMSNGSLSLDGVTVSGNTATNNGGGIDMYCSGLVTITNSTITDNQAGDYGGGIYYHNNTGTAHLVMTDCVVTGNTANDNNGGGMDIAGPGLEMTRCDISNNTANGYGGGLSSAPTAPALTVLQQCTFESNTNQKYHGGGAWISGTATIDECRFENNQILSGGYGGGLSSAGTAMKNTIFRGNTADGEGGGAYFKGAINVSGCLFESNHAGSIGGGATVNGNGTGSITNSTFHANTADGQGGGGLAFRVYYSPAPLGADIDLSFVTITGNIGDYDCTSNGGTGCDSDPGGGIYLGDDVVTHNVTLKSCVIADNRDSRNPMKIQWYCDLSAGEFASAGYNFIGRKWTATTGFTNGVNNDQIGGLTPLYPKLMDLGDYGGPTYSRMPMPDSPLVNAGGPATDVNGTAVTMDQRGKRRPCGSAADIGAVEKEATILTPIYLLLSD